MTNKNEKTCIDVGKFQLDLYLRERHKHFTVNNKTADSIQVLNGSCLGS